jgi:hypothetical protein
LTGVEPLPEGEVLAVVFGLPGPRVRNAADALREIARIGRRTCVAAEINSVDDWRSVCATGESTIAISQFPSPELITRISQSCVPALVVLDHPPAAAALLVADHHAVVSALRTVSSSIACLSGRLFRDKAGIRQSNARNLDAFVVHIAEGLESNICAADMNRLESLITELSTVNDDPSRTARLAPAPTAHFSSLANSVLPAIEPDPEEDDEAVRIAWPGSLFLLGDSPDTPMHDPVELSGPARCVLYGPYLHIPPGAWSASVTLGLADCAGMRSFTLEVVCGEVMTKGRFHCSGSGLFRTRLEFEHGSPDVPIELRLFLDAGEIYGSITSIDVRLKSSKPQIQEVLDRQPDFAG